MGDEIVLLPLFGMLVVVLVTSFAAITFNIEAGRQQRIVFSLSGLVAAQEHAVSALQEQVAAQNGLDAARVGHIAALERQISALEEQISVYQESEGPKP